ncbi:hypothetical protein I3843_05G223900 [Carya illinoinensis]|uniref:Uncharacterized protein n=1 Tax=Carya illinoinensis TaxID=32201 RepID=A0A8T1QP81_CARIL|nr:hypothetical protein I3760_05G245300 [Carya illinoinensis]KAG6655914.1 hypothetical protein CIPAW_05G249700 [Carya illinoinensis]KAG7981252.1 hypothetical protein I3843_05G223900 [Carya illinoinensis]
MYPMAAKLNQVFSTLFLALIFLSFLGTIRPDDSSCPYPCYPPPTGPGASTPTTPAITLPPPPPSQFVSYPPPAGYNPTPAGYLPYNYPPPYGTSYGNSPPPPDPILPYFPFYYKKPLHRTDDSAATATLGRSVIMIATANLLLFLSIFSFHVF